MYLHQTFFFVSSRLSYKLIKLFLCPLLSLGCISLKHNCCHCLSHMIYCYELIGKHKLYCLYSYLIRIIIGKFFCISYKIITKASNKTTHKFKFFRLLGHFKLIKIFLKPVKRITFSYVALSVLVNDDKRFTLWPDYILRINTHKCISSIFLIITFHKETFFFTSKAFIYLYCCLINYAHCLFVRFQNLFH